MDIVFGLWADAGAWPEHGGGRVGALGAPVVGPIGLLEILETARGLGAPGIPNVVRIAAFQAALESTDRQPRFWSRSLAVDGWATARTLLRWRDELVDAGWDDKQEWCSPRLADLAAANAAAADLPPGIADRAAALAADLATRPVLPIRRVRLIDARDLHSAGWRRLLDRIEACGVAIEQVTIVPAAPEHTALGRLQRWMTGVGSIAGGADGTVTIATSASTALAAEVTGQWFAERGDREAVLIAQEGDTHPRPRSVRCRAAKGWPEPGFRSSRLAPDPAARLQGRMGTLRSARADGASCLPDVAHRAPRGLAARRRARGGARAGKHDVE